jgi:hypothetical protein
MMRKYWPFVAVVVGIAIDFVAVAAAALCFDLILLLHRPLYFLV